jgi:MFS family permease
VTRDLRLLSGAVLLSAAGDLLLMVVLALRVHELTGSGFAVGGLFAAHMAPIVALAGVAGRLVDRLENRALLLAVSLAQAGVAGALIFADGLAAILVLTALLGAGVAVASPAEAALVPATVPADRLQKANGWVETARYTGFAVGPLLAGVLTAAGGVSLGLAANAASFVAVALAAWAMRARRAGTGRAAAASGDGGLRLLLDDPTLRVTLGAAVAALAFISACMTVDVFYVRDVVGAGPAGYSLVIAGWMAGMVLGSLGVGGRLRAPLAVAGLLALMLQGAGMAASALWPVLAWVIGGYFAGGIGHGVKNVLLRTLIQQRVPGEAHGRAFAAYNAARNTAELGALTAGGVLVGVLGPQTALFIAGLGPVVCGALGLLALSMRPTAAVASPQPS